MKSVDDLIGRPRRLEGRVAIVTGGGGANSIGRAISLRYGREGAQVAVLDINAEGARSVSEEIVEAGGVSMPVVCDITDLDQCRAAAKKVAEGEPEAAPTGEGSEAPESADGDQPAKKAAKRAPRKPAKDAAEGDGERAEELRSLAEQVHRFLGNFERDFLLQQLGADPR